MKIKSFSTETFAGIVDKKLEFNDGINIILGNNESGKSTLINAMYYTLCQPAKLNKKTDKKFIEACFPSVEGKVDTIDAEMTLELNDDRYKIKKIWDNSKSGDAANISVRRNSDPLLRSTQAEEQLGLLMQYGTGVYSNLIFGRQNSEEEVLDWCYKFFGSGDDDSATVKNIIKSAFSAADGISADKLKRIIDETITSMSGNWNVDADKPVNKKSGRWTKGNGSVITAYYAYEDAKAKKDEAVKIDERIETLNKKIKEYSERSANKRKKLSKLQEQKGSISQKSNFNKLINKSESELEEAENAIKSWPDDELLYARMRRLKEESEESEKRNRKKGLKEKLDKIESAQSEIDTAKAEIEKYPDILDDKNKLDEAEKELNKVTTKLMSANLCANIFLEEGYHAEVTTASGNTSTVKSSTVIDADGYVNIVIPGVASIRVAPQDMDVDKLEEEKDKYQDIINETLKQYRVNSIDEYNVLYENVKNNSISIKDNEKDIIFLLGNKSVEDIKNEYDSIKINSEISVSESFEKEIKDILAKINKNSLDEAIGGIENKIKSFSDKYISISELEGEIEKIKKDIEKCNNELANLGECMDISEEDYENKLNELKQAIDDYDKEKDSYNVELGGLKEKQYPDISELEQDKNDKKNKWKVESQKLRYYIRIKNDFENIISSQDNAYNEFYNSFNSYLSEITNGSLEFLTGSNFLDLRSNSNMINESKILSEGTKKTLLLAFRLAILDYLYPDGNGFIVLDDELIDMDPDRRGRSAAILKKFAEKNQVIMTTCDPSIAALLSDNPIRM